MFLSARFNKGSFPNTGGKAVSGSTLDGHPPTGEAIALIP